jgi:hypothetical protein
MVRKKSGFMKFFKRTEVLSGLLVVNLLLVAGIMVMNLAMSETTPKGASEWTEVPGAPTANAFIMSYCPYGLQFLKAYIPVIELLGKDANLMVNFVDYAMHGEKEIIENNRMYCIQYHQNDKFTAYLRCFVQSGDAAACIESADIDSKKLESCMEDLDSEYGITALFNDQSTWSGGSYPQYPVEAELNNLYGVGGSPTFVLEGTPVSVNRSPEAIKQAVCSVFASAPAACNTVLSSTAEQPSFGAMGSGTASSGSDVQCG